MTLCTDGEGWTSNAVFVAKGGGGASWGSRRAGSLKALVALYGPCFATGNGMFGIFILYVTNRIQVIDFARYSLNYRAGMQFMHATLDGSLEFRIRKSNRTTRRWPRFGRKFREFEEFSEAFGDRGERWWC